MDKNLEQFLAIAEAGSYVGASERLLVSQPALSYNLKKLEAKLGVKLFERSSRGVRLTSYGEILYENTLMMRRLYTNAMDSIARQKAQQEEGIRIGTGYSTWNLFLREYVVGHFADRPDIPINVSLGNELLCMDQLLAGELALFVGHHIDNLAQEDMVHFIPLGEIHAGYTVRDNHPLLGKPRTRAEIRRYPRIQVATHDARQARLLRNVYVSKKDLYSDMSNDTSSPDFVSNSLNVCLDALRNSDAVMFHSRLFRKLLTERGLQAVELAAEEILPSWTMGIYINNEKTNDRTVKRLVEALLANRHRVLDLPADEGTSATA